MTSWKLSGDGILDRVQLLKREPILKFFGASKAYSLS